MSITTYAELKTAVATWLTRSDLTSQIPDFITLAETRIIRGDETMGFETPPLRIKDMEATTTLSCSTETTALPSAFLELITINLVQGGEYYPISQWTGEQQIASMGSAGTDTPVSFSITEDGLRLFPIPDTTYSVNIRYFGKYARFTNPTDTNWVLTNAPNVYLFAALTEAYLFTRNMEQAEVYARRTAGAIKALNKEYIKSRYGRNPLVQQVGHSAP